jgi:tetratricopeptide (TPR) repeat protein
MQNHKALYEDALFLIRRTLTDISNEDSELRQNLLFKEYFLLTEIGILYLDLAQYDQAESILTISLQKIIHYGELYNSRPNFQGFTLYNIGLIYLGRENFPEALKYFLDVRDNYPRFDGGGLFLGIGSVYFAMGDYEEAEAAFIQAVAFNFIGDPGLKGFALNALGKSRAKINDYEGAFESYLQALRLFRNLGDLSGESLTLSNIAALAEAKDEIQLAIAFYKESVNLLESIRQNLAGFSIEALRSYTEAVSDTYRSLAALSNYRVRARV